MPRLANYGEEPIAGEELRQHIVLDFTRDARFVLAAAVGHEDLPVVGAHHLKRYASAVGGQCWRVEAFGAFVQNRSRFRCGRRGHDQALFREGVDRTTPLDPDQCAAIARQCWRKSADDSGLARRRQEPERRCQEALPPLPAVAVSDAMRNGPCRGIRKSSVRPLASITMGS